MRVRSATRPFAGARIAAAPADGRRPVVAEGGVAPAWRAELQHLILLRRQSVKTRQEKGIVYCPLLDLNSDFIPG